MIRLQIQLRSPIVALPPLKPETNSGRCTFRHRVGQPCQLTSVSSPGNDEWAYAGNGEFDMTHSNLKVEVQGSHIVVVLRGTCFRAKYRKQDAPWLATDEYGPDDPDAPMTLSEFRSVAWTAANDAARQLGWIKSCDELHGEARLAGRQ
jgi:hypothetical protein